MLQVQKTHVKLKNLQKQNIGAEITCKHRKHADASENACKKLKTGMYRTENTSKYRKCAQMQKNCADAGGGWGLL